MGRQSIFLIGELSSSEQQFVLDLEREFSLDGSAFSSPSEFCAGFEAAPRGCVLVRPPAIAEGLALLDELQRRRWKIPVILVQANATVQMAVSALKRGACAFLEDPVKPLDLLTAVVEALELDRQQESAPPSAQPSATLFHLLSERERQIVRLVSGGMSSKLIARELGISRKTVEQHRSNVMRKLGIGNTAELVRIAVENGLG